MTAPFAPPHDPDAPARGEALADYDYALPQGRIALRPAVPRDSARLLLHRGGAQSDRRVSDLPSLLRPGDRLVVNDSRVIPARLRGVRERGESVAGVELTLLTQTADASGAGGLWRAFAKPAKRLAPGDTVRFGTVTGRVTKREGPEVDVAFDASPLAAGAMPLPPYIAARRAPDAQDRRDYQTVYAEPEGSVAAPTAGLHFTDRLLEALSGRGVALSRVTLHVGAGTFLPVSAGSLDAHKMHAEAGTVSADTVAEIAATKAAGGRIVAVGTTSLRLLESAAASGTLAPFAADTDLFIRPGVPIRVADALLTNFHLPRSTLLMLVAAFVGYDAMRAIYDHALAGDYRFYSYGDASLLWRPGA